MNKLDKSFKKNNLEKLLRQFALLFVVVFIIVLMSFLSKTFLTANNIRNILRQISLNGILAVGMTFVILTGGIDLSVGSTVAIAGVVCGSLLMQGMNTFQVILISLVFSLLVGVLNGYLISYVGFQPFIATLATMTISRGAVLAYADGKPYTISDESFKVIGQGTVKFLSLEIPVPVILLVVVTILGLVILTMTTFGRYIFAIGGNYDAARFSGVRVKKIQFAVYIISALCAWVVGLILAARISSGQPTAGESYEMDAIAATAIGGTSMSGGTGSLTGTILGFFIIGLLSNSMNLLNINSFYQQIVKGLLIIIAVFLDMKSKRRSE
ncbi:MAG: ABC transporter permease [Saccharofermentanales bacterium]|jgi:ribose transport system permease protein